MKSVVRYLPWIVLVFALIYSSMKVISPDKIQSEYSLEAFSQLPVSASGRTKPLDTVARNSLMNISGRQSIRQDGQSISAIEWYIELVTRPELAFDRQVFRIDHPDVLSLVGLSDKNRTRFSFNEIRDSSNEITRQAMLASRVKAKAQDPLQRAFLVLAERMMLYSTLTQLDEPYLVPPLSDPSADWRSFVSVLEETPNDPDAMALLGVLQSYRDNDSATFNSQLAAFKSVVDNQVPYDARKSRYEVIFNQVQPFLTATVLYLMAFLFGCFGLLLTQSSKKELSRSLLNSMTALIVVAFIVQTIGISSRVYLQGRPPITNLYSSAVFISWFGSILGIIIDRQMKIGLGGIMASVLGFGTLIIAHNLGGSNDTMGMMQAVLDSNFWLATHVVVITIGYSATFFAGFMGIAYVFLGVFTKTLDHERGKSLSKMIYGVICFAAVTSFVGTVLGGIWADQSWGRFWGWDAKENGAALIVLMLLLILHARWGGMVKDRGVVVLAISCNIITAWSWFGTNMLGVGLHSYGFTQSAVFWLAVFILSQLVIMGIGMIPMSLWRSKFQRQPKSVST